MSQARRFEELSVDHEGRTLAPLEPVETGVRPLAKLAAIEGEAVEEPRPRPSTGSG
jgi:DNA recombination protein RmuC